MYYESMIRVGDPAWLVVVEAESQVGVEGVMYSTYTHACVQQQNQQQE